MSNIYVDNQQSYIAPISEKSELPHGTYNYMMVGTLKGTQNNEKH